MVIPACPESKCLREKVPGLDHIGGRAITTLYYVNETQNLKDERWIKKN